MIPTRPIGPDIGGHSIEATCAYDGGLTTRHHLDDAFDHGSHAEQVFDEHASQCPRCKSELAKNVTEQEVPS